MCLAEHPETRQCLKVLSKIPKKRRGSLYFSLIPGLWLSHCLTPRISNTDSPRHDILYVAYANREFAYGYNTPFVDVLVAVFLLGFVKFARSEAQRKRYVNALLK